MEDYVDIMQLGYQPSDMKDLKPEARTVYKRRVSYQQMISNLLKYNMIELTEPVKVAPNNEEDKEESDKQQEEEKKEEKILYDIHFVYRTVEKRLSQQPQNYVASSFGFKDRIGEGVNTFLHAFYDPSLNSGTITIKTDETVHSIENKSLAEIDAQPLEFRFQFLDNFLNVRLSADS